MRSFLYNYANGIRIESDELQYIDSLKNFIADSINSGQPLLPDVTNDVYEYRAINSDNPNDSHAKTRQFGQMGFSATGRTPSDFYTYIDNIEAIIEQKKIRTGMVSNV